MSEGSSVSDDDRPGGWTETELATPAALAETFVLGDAARRGRLAGGGDGRIAGLYVGDGSLFPTGLGVNPMITIMVLARRVARTVLAEP